MRRYQIRYQFETVRHEIEHFVGSPRTWEGTLDQLSWCLRRNRKGLVSPGRPVSVSYCDEDNY